ncbi:fatty-acid amide hydrolase 2-A isoform X2 [Bradysia coprophila]|uniref:fatty-acid amide hydrolase 2-A isoform X2 n=1 Tax=Bradysia coprophila TaxID=38358 RepID=UPI00187DAC73|nr:fatty-acid amide hydrolase 2-A isoform X2 [Bradysia coprophila]
MEFLSNSIVRSTIYYLFRFIDEIMSYAMRRFLRGAMVVFGWFVVPYSRISVFRTAKRRLPAITNPLLEIPAVKLAEMIRNKEVTSEAIVQAYIDRCKEVNPILNAIVDERFEEALKEARIIDRDISNGVRTKEQMKDQTPLLGLPVTIKESIAVMGLRNQGGRVFKEKRVAEEDAPCVQQVKKHGGMVLLVSNTPELCMCWETYNKVSGQTNNPYDNRRTPGGSSGGEAALLGSGASLIGLSSDIAGSARLPAMFSGIFGHKPTPYAVSYQGHIPGCSDRNFGDYFTIAPMARYACDLPLLLRCISDPNGTKLTPEREVAINDINFFFMNNDGPSGTTRALSGDVKRAIDDVAKHFNAKLVKIDKLKWSLELAMSMMLRIENVETIYNKGIDGEPKKRLGVETIRYLLGRSESIFPSVVVGHLQELVKLFPESRHNQLTKIASKLKQEFQELLGTNGVFIYPTFPDTAHYHYEIYHKLVDTSYMMVFNAIGLPVTNCMVRLDKNNLPIGIQVRIVLVCQTNSTLNKIHFF